MKRRIISPEAYERELGSTEWVLNAIFAFFFGLPVVLAVVGGLLMCLFVPGMGREKIAGIICFVAGLASLKTALAILCNNWRLGLMFFILYGVQVAVVFMASKDYVRILLDIRQAVLG